jgi:hypothetical protein
MRPYQRVRLLTNKYLEDGIKEGDVGVIVEKHDDSNFEVDFSDENGTTIAIFAFPKEELEFI